jgi:hypothetical protein
MGEDREPISLCSVVDARARACHIEGAAKVQQSCTLLGTAEASQGDASVQTPIERADVPADS